MTIPDSGDESLWQIAIKNYYPKLVNYMHFVTKDRFLAEDIIQEAFAVAIDRFYQLKNPNKFLPWITSIAFNIAKVQIKDHKKVTPVEDIDPFIQVIHYDNSIIEMADREEIKTLIQNAIDKLSSQERNIVIMRYYLDMKNQEIALAMGVSQGTVKKGLFRAKAKLYNDLQYLSGKEGE